MNTNTINESNESSGGNIFLILIAIVIFIVASGESNSDGQANGACTAYAQTAYEDDLGNVYAETGEVLDPYSGTIQGPSGMETYYNLPMDYVCELMRNIGYDYEYWVRDDGVKMYGPYIMCAADLRIRPKGTVIRTSLGDAMVCDTGTFVYMYYDSDEGAYVPSYVSNPDYNSERIYDPDSYVPDDNCWYPYSYQIDIATTW